MKNWIILSDSRIFSSQARHNVAVYLNNEVVFVTAIACCSTSFFSSTFLFAAIILTFFLVQFLKPSQHILYSCVSILNILLNSREIAIKGVGCSILSREHKVKHVCLKKLISN